MFQGLENVPLRLSQRPARRHRICDLSGSVDPLFPKICERLLRLPGMIEQFHGMAASGRSIHGHGVTSLRW